MTIALLLFVVGMLLSAMFSGTETGFYRANRARLLIHALEGDRISRGLLWAVNHPPLFVATVLVGNNVANYVTSAAIVMAAGILAAGSFSMELAAPLLMAPFIFIYGELLPKNVFLAAPNRLLRRCGPPFAVAALVFLPVSLVLWAASKLLEQFGRTSTTAWQMVLARRELGELLTEGHAVGLLKPTQQLLAQTTLAVGGKPLSNFVVPLARFPRATTRMSPADVVRLARRTQQPLLPIEDGNRNIAGYVRAADGLVGDQADLPIRPLLNLEEKQSYLAALAHLLGSGEPIARVVNRKQQPLGYVTLSGLRQALLNE